MSACLVPLISLEFVVQFGLKEGGEGGGERGANQYKSTFTVYLCHVHMYSTCVTQKYMHTPLCVCVTIKLLFDVCRSAMAILDQPVSAARVLCLISLSATTNADSNCKEGE